MLNCNIVKNKGCGVWSVQDVYRFWEPHKIVSNDQPYIGRNGGCKRTLDDSYF